MGVLRSRVGRVAAVCAVVSVCVMPEMAAYKMFQQKLPNGANVPGVDAIGHERAGGPNNDFGLDFIEAMFKWTKTFCEKDSDGDGQTNGQELGDPCCEFEHRKNEKARWAEGVSHPGDPALKADPALWEGVVCGAAVAEAEAEAGPAGTEAAAAEEKVEEMVVEAAVQGEAGMQEEKQLTAGAPALHASVMLSAAVLTVMVIYVVVMRTGRRSSRYLPIFRQQRREPM